MYITIAGAGYVGMSIAVMLAKKHHVTALDVSDQVVDAINNHKCHLKEKDMITIMQNETLDLRATKDPKEAYAKCDMAIIAVPTNYDEKLQSFDVSILDEAVETAVKYVDGIIAIKSTAPVGYTAKQIQLYRSSRIIFSPEFMSEGSSYHDVTNPSRIIVGSDKTIHGNMTAKIFADVLKEEALNDPEIIITGSTEAEAIKLFANNYLAMRVAFFNELDAYAESNGLSTAEIIHGVTTDPRIGEGYANPSFGYGGYCFPKDTKQLTAQMQNVPGTLIKAIPSANRARIRGIASRVAGMTDGIIGIYGIAMKAGSGNARASSSVAVAEELAKMGREVIVYDPELRVQNDRFTMTNDLEYLANNADIILANRRPKAIDVARIKEKLYTRDIYGYN